MGKREPKSSAPGGYGNITSKGYRHIWCTKEKRLRMEHVVVWESSHGPVPHGMQVHHKDENPINNAIDNLEILDPLTHKRVHSGCELRNGEWWKPCRKCGVPKPVEAEFYKHKDGISSWCRGCCVKNATENKRKRRARDRIKHERNAR